MSGVRTGEFGMDQEEANVYIAGHRIGFEGEASHLVFYDLDVPTNGDAR